MDINAILKELSETVGIGHIDCAREALGRVLSPFATTEKVGALGLIAKINANKEKTILLDAHIDQVGFIVTNVDSNGFLTVSACGGIDLRHLPTKEVIIHGKKDITGVFSATPPHLTKEEIKFDSIDKLKIDTGLNEKAADYISPGDFVTFKNGFLPLQNSRVCSKSLDNRAGCAALVMLAERLSKKELPVNVTMLFSDSEELGLRGARTASYAVDAHSAIVIDVSFGDAPDVPAAKCGKLGEGAMIGISPILNRSITRRLEEIAQSNNIPFQREVMGSSTGTNADVISIAKSGIDCGLISIPLRNMHTDCEIVDTADILSVVDILEKFIMGGISND